MKITIESTEQMVEIVRPDGATIPARIWVGTTESGIPVHCYITRIAAPAEGVDLSQFARELQEHAPPSAELRGIPLRMVL